MRSIHQLWLSLLLLLSLPLNAETVRVLNWEAYLSENVQKKWEKESSSNLEVIYFDNDQQRDSILLESKHHNIDIAIVDEVIAERFGKEGRLLKLTEQNVPNINNNEPFWRERCSNYAIPYLWGTLGIIYRSDIIKQPPQSWREILEPSDELKGHIAMLDDYTDMIAPALFLDGFDLNTENPSELKQAFNRLKAQTEHVLTYEYPISFVQTSPKKDDLYMAVAYGGDQFTLNEIVGEEGLWKYAVPKEGTVLWVDCLAVTSTSTQQEKALELINYLSTPKVAAQNATDLFYATPNIPALEELNPEFRNNPNVFPEHEILKKSGLYEVLSNSNIKQRIRISSAIINLHESKQAR
ncbi:polyamine ABC transporter substrate-binding protein [Neptuniibacter caesariensis]|uniref:Putative putrescine-binding periplasmic protein n=1 Tax=Neptuniibacter caesariensis TaxID=207954 RepID=A0A7U8C690_NEPCE|nr:spermidine/putrescine ABC transporter substrate-binding protein [Neptuniibacter caesariensis]EAR62282.1 putative putrescine-binding periplasmic protein [Oceanospirillum sp. MED92] [Neptuniibacter caesariensis]